MQITDVVLGLAAGVGIDLSPDGKTAYYVEWSLGELSKVETWTGAIETTLTGLTLPQDVEVDWDANEIFVSERTGPISQVFPHEGKKKIVDPGGAPHQLALRKQGNQRNLYTVCFDSGDLLRIDPDAATVATVLSGLGHPVGIVVDKNEKFAYVTEQDSGSLTRVELSSGTKNTVVSGLVAPFFLAWDKSAKGIFCVQRDPVNNLVRIDLNSSAVSVVAGGLAWRPSGVAPTVDDKLIYICADRELEVISWNGVPPIKPPNPPFEVHSIEFNTDGGNALRLKHHETNTTVPTPEYIIGSRNEPAAYVAGTLPKIRVVLRKLPAHVAGPYADRCDRQPRRDPPQDRHAVVRWRRAEFADRLRVDVAAAGAVGKPDVSIDWYARRANVPSVPVPVGSATHRLYLPLATPVAPWSPPLWVARVRSRLRLGRGRDDRDGAAGLITERYNSSGMVSYDTVNGDTMYGLFTFSLGEMLERLTGGPGLGGKVNCTDSANTVATLSNLLGCELWESRMGSSFYMNSIIAIGYNAWAVPFWGGFSYHEVAWKGGATANDALFDGCLKVDGGRRSDRTSVVPHTPLLPVNMLFGDCTTMNYRLRLCVPDRTGCAACQPNTSTRQRRPIS